MSKARFYFLRIGISGGVGMTIYLLFQLLLALLVVKGALPETRLMVFQTAAGGVSVLLSGCLAMSMTKWVPASGLTGIFIVAITLLLSFGLYDGVLLNAETLLRMITMLIGGLLPALPIGKRGRRRKRSAGSGRVRRT